MQRVLLLVLPDRLDVPYDGLPLCGGYSQRGHRLVILLPVYKKDSPYIEFRKERIQERLDMLFCLNAFQTANINIK